MDEEPTPAEGGRARIGMDGDPVRAPRRPRHEQVPSELGHLVRIQPVRTGRDDADREFAYTGGAEQALGQAETDGWSVVSVKDDWATVF